MKKYLKLIIIITLILIECRINDLPGFMVVPVASFSILPTKAEYEIGEEIGFENTSTGGNFEWNFGSQALPASTSTLKDPGKISYSTIGEKEIKLKVSFGSQTVSDAIIKSIKIIEKSIAPPKPDFSFSPDSCISPCNIQFTNKSINADEFQWDFGDATTSSALNPPPKLYTNPGNYKVRLTARNSGSVRDTSKMVKILPPKPKALFEVINDSCIVSCEIQFKNNSTAATSFIWDFGDGKGNQLVIDKSNKTISYESKGTKKVKLIAINSIGEMDSLTVNITILPNYFKSVNNISDFVISEPVASERIDGLIQVVYREGVTFRSILIDRNRGARLPINIQNLSGDLLVVKAMPRPNGEILILANDKPNKLSNVIKIRATQSVAFNKSFEFSSGGTLTLAHDFIINSVGDICITGSRTQQEGATIGYTRLSIDDGKVLKTSFFTLDDNFKYAGWGDAICQRPDLGYLIKVKIFALFTGSQLINISSTEAIQTKPVFNPIIEVADNAIYQTNGRYFIPDGTKFREVLSDGKVVATNQNIGFSIANIIKNSNDNLILTGINGNNVIWAELTKSASITAVLPNKTFNLGTGTPSIKSLLQTIDGGYLICGTYLFGGQTDIFLIKLNSKGAIE